jgi:hypothetical protein
MNLLGINNKMMFKMENGTFMVSSAKDYYAINTEMFRAVMNGFAIDMTVPVTLTR